MRTTPNQGLPSIPHDRATTAKRKNHTRLEHMLEAVSDGFWEWTVATGQMFFSAQWLNLLGYAPEDVQPSIQFFFDILHHEDRARIKQGIDVQVGGDRPVRTVEVRLRRKSGEYLWVYCRSKVVAHDGAGRAERVIGAITDIADRKIAEERWRQAQRIAQIGNWELDLPNGRLYWSDEIFRIFEIDPKRFGASYEAFLAMVHPEDRARVDEAYQIALRTRQPYRIVHRLRMPDGRIKHVEEQCETDYAPDGTPLRSRGTVQDVSERMRQEADLRAALETKEILLREVHHRVKNNLQVISSLLSMQETYESDGDARALLRESVNRLRTMRLIHDRLYQTDGLTRVDFAAVVREMVDVLVQSYSVNPSVNVQVTAEACVLNVETAMPCGLILNELVSNAIEHGLKGQPGDLGVAIQGTHTGTFMLTVRDTGPGLPDGFDIASQSSLGLKLVMSLVKQLKGTLVFENHQGVSFAVMFKELHSAR